MYIIYSNGRNGNPEGSPIAQAPTDLKARKLCARLMERGYYSRGLWAEDHTTKKFFLIEPFGKGVLLYTNSDSVEKKLDMNGNVIKKKKAEWRPFGL